MWVVSGQVLVAYLALVTVLMLTPGPDMLFVLASGSVFVGLAAKLALTR